MTGARAALAAALLLAAPTARAQEGQGFAELRLAWSPGAAGNKLQVVERARPTLQTSFGERFKLVATLEAGLAEGRNQTEELRRLLEAQGFGPLIAAAGLTWPARARTFFHVDGASDYLAVDRLYLDWYGERLDVRVGRQALHWGSAQFFNPTDPFPEVLLAEPWRPRAGVNAARAHLAFGGLTDATLVAAIDDALQTGRAALRLRTNRWGTDFALVGALRGGGDWLAGLDVRGTAGVGFWLEAALHPTGGSVHEELALGVDYSFPVLEKLVLLAQLYRNGAGETDPDRYARSARLSGIEGPCCGAPGTPFAAQKRDPFAPFTLARDYLLASAALQATPELTFTLAFLQNLDDGTAAALPTLTWAALDWLEVSLAAQVPLATWGSGGELKPRPQDLRLLLGGLTADLAGLVPAATLTCWTRASF